MRRSSSVLLCLALIWSESSSAAERAAYDLLLKGGHVIDPKTQVNDVLDVAISDGHIVRVTRDIPAKQARQAIEVSGLYVVPGLIDVHVHVYAMTDRPNIHAGGLSVIPDAHSFRSGVTTMVDAGTSGWRSFHDFKRRIIDNSKTRVLAWLNIVGAGMVDRDSQQVWEDMNPRAAAEMAKQFSDLIVGIKTAHYDGPEWIAVERAIAAGRLANIPVMVDFGAFRPERPFQQLVLEKMRAGDVYTHMFYRPVPILGDDGRLLPHLPAARQRGVKFDLGHGRDSFLWWQAAPAAGQGWFPDTISTDLWFGNMNAGMKDMVHCMSKFLNLGVSLESVVRMSTANSADLIRRHDLGTLQVGSTADVAVLRQLEGQFGFLDARNARLNGTRKLQCELTLRQGEVVWDLNALAGHDWKPEDQNRNAE